MDLNTNILDYLGIHKKNLLSIYPIVDSLSKVLTESSLREQVEIAEHCYEFFLASSSKNPGVVLTSSNYTLVFILTSELSIDGYVDVTDANNNSYKAIGSKSGEVEIIPIDNLNTVTTILKANLRESDSNFKPLICLGYAASKLSAKLVN